MACLGLGCVWCGFWVLRLCYCSVTVAETGGASLRQLFWLSSGLRRSWSLFLGRYRIAQEVIGTKEPEPSMQKPKQTAPNCFSPSINWILFMHLHHLLAIFTSPYYYIYNDLFSVIYWTEWCNLRINQDLKQIYAKFSKKIHNFFLWIPDTKEIYKIVHKYH